MKKTVLLLFALSASFGLFAQQKTVLGFYGGLSDATIHQEKVSGAASNTSLSSLPGLALGAYVGFPLAPKWYLRTGLDYSMMGAKYTGYFFNIKYDKQLSFKTPYLSIPLLAQYKLTNTTGTTGLSVLLGPEYNILLAAKAHFSGGDDANYKSKMNSSNISGVGGLEYLFPLGKSGHNWGLAARYRYGFGNTIKDATNNSSNKIFSRSMLFTVSYQL